MVDVLFGWTSSLFIGGFVIRYTYDKLDRYDKYPPYIEMVKSQTEIITSCETRLQLGWNARRDKAPLKFLSLIGLLTSLFTTSYFCNIGSSLFVNVFK